MLSQTGFKVMQKINAIFLPTFIFLLVFTNIFITETLQGGSPAPRSLQNLALCSGSLSFLYSALKSTVLRNHQKVPLNGPHFGTVYSAGQKIRTFNVMDFL